MANPLQAEQTSRKIDHVGHSGVHPMSGPWPTGKAALVEQGHLGHPEQRPSAIPTTLSRLSSSDVSLGFGRVMFGGYFLYNAANHFMNHESMTEYARSRGVPLPGLAVVGCGVLLALGGMSLITGIRPTAGASCITTFLSGVSPIMHNFWAIDDERQRLTEMINFTKNMALIGGACLAAAIPQPWPGSVPLARPHESTALATTR